MSLFFNMLSRLVITFLPRSKHLLISWLQSPSAVILEPWKIKSATVSPSICHEVMGPDAMILVFWMLSFKPTFSLSSFTSIKRLFSCVFISFLQYRSLQIQGFSLDSLSSESFSEKYLLQNIFFDPSSGPVAKNLPTDAGEMGLIPGPGRCHMQLSPWTSTTLEPILHNRRGHCNKKPNIMTRN